MRSAIELPAQAGPRVSLAECLDHLIVAHRVFCFFVLFVCGGAYLGMLYGIPLAIRGLYAGDMNANLGWTHEFVEPGAFGPSPGILYDRTFYGGPGLSVLYRIGVPIFGVERFGELLAFLLGAATIAIGFSLGRRALDGRLAGGFVGAFLLPALCRPGSLNLWAVIHGGLPRSFSVPLLLGGVAAMWKPAPRTLAAILLTAAALYPPAFLLLSGTALLLDISRWRLPGPWLSTSIVLGLALIFLSQVPATQEFGAPVTWPMASHMSFFTSTGPLVVAPRESRLGSMVATYFGITLAPVVILGASLVLSDRPRGAFRPLFALVISGMALFIVAYLVFFRMYYPSRYIGLALGVGSWVAAIFGMATALRHIRVRMAVARLLGISGVCLWLGLVAINTFRIYPRGHTAGSTGLYRSPVTSGICGAIHALPISSLLATSLDISSDIHFLCHRGVLVKLDDLFPHRQKFFEDSRARARAVAVALTSDRWDDVTSLRTLGVTHVVVDRQNLVSNQPAWVESFEILRVKPAASPAVLHPPREAVMFDDGRFELLALPPSPG